MVVHASLYAAMHRTEMKTMGAKASLRVLCREYSASAYWPRVPQPHSTGGDPCRSVMSSARTACRARHRSAYPIVICNPRCTGGDTGAGGPSKHAKLDTRARAQRRAQPKVGESLHAPGEDTQLCTEPKWRRWGPRRHCGSCVEVYSASAYRPRVPQPHSTVIGGNPCQSVMSSAQRAPRARQHSAYPLVICNPRCAGGDTAADGASKHAKLDSRARAQQRAQPTVGESPRAPERTRGYAQS